MKSKTTGIGVEIDEDLPEVSPRLSLYWKPLRRLLEDGSPLDPVTMLFLDLGAGLRVPFVALSRSRGKRLILWPPSSDVELAEFCDGSKFPVHHVTLELVNGRTHFTKFENGQSRSSVSKGWKLLPRDDGSRMWLICACRLDLLKKQVGILKTSVRAPRSDSSRRDNESVRYFENLNRIVLRNPHVEGDYLIAVMHLVENSQFKGPLSEDHFPLGRIWDDFVDGWADRFRVAIAPNFVEVGDTTMLLLTAAPPGKIKDGFLLAGAV